MRNVICSKHMSRKASLLDHLRHRLLFAEEVKAHLLEVISGFLISPEGLGVHLRNADQDATQGSTSFELRCENVPVNDSVEDETSFRKSTFLLCSNINAEGTFRIVSTEFFQEDAKHKSQQWEYSGRFDPFHDEPSEVASNVLLSYHQMIDEDYISAKIIKHVWPMIGRRPLIGEFFDVNNKNQL